MRRWYEFYSDIENALHFANAWNMHSFEDVYLTSKFLTVVVHVYSYML